MTPAQQRFVDTVRSYGPAPHFWDVANDWAIAGPLVLRNINRTVAVLVRDGILTIDDDGVLALPLDLTRKVEVESRHE